MFAIQLVIINSFFQISPETRACSYCQKLFQPQPGAIHLGVDHKVAQMMVEAFNKGNITCCVFRPAFGCTPKLLKIHNKHNLKVYQSRRYLTQWASENRMCPDLEWSTMSGFRMVSGFEWFTSQGHFIYVVVL